MDTPRLHRHHGERSAGSKLEPPIESAPPRRRYRLRRNNVPSRMPFQATSKPGSQFDETGTGTLYSSPEGATSFRIEDARSHVILDGEPEIALSKWCVRADRGRRGWRYQTAAHGRTGTGVILAPGYLRDSVLKLGRRFLDSSLIRAFARIVTISGSGGLPGVFRERESEPPARRPS